jgi:flagellar FliJ protein
MSKFHAIELAITVASRRRDALAKEYAQAIRNLDFGKDQLAQLEGYAEDTDARWIGSHLSALSGELVRHHYQFVERLQQAVQMQNNAIGTLEGQREAARQALLQAEFRLAGLQQVLDRRQAAVQLAHDRREQRATDEFAAQRHAHRIAISIAH